MSPAAGDSKREGRGQDTCASHGGHTEGSGVRDAPVWHNRGSAMDHRSVGLAAGVETPSLRHLGKVWR